MDNTKDAYYRTARFKDCHILAKKMRKADVVEIDLLAGFTPKQALVESFHASPLDRHSIILNGEVIGMFGVSNHGGAKWATPWLLASDKITQIPLTFLRHSKHYINSREYPLLMNYVHAENTLSIAWLKHLGFSFIRQVTGARGRGLFYEFVRIK
jgi:hypothetical protein